MSGNKGQACKVVLKFNFLTKTKRSINGYGGSGDYVEGWSLQHRKRWFGKTGCWISGCKSIQCGTTTFTWNRRLAEKLDEFETRSDWDVDR